MLQFLNQSVLANPTSSFTPKHLFSAGEQGVWYDPSDLSTLFQDSAGTTPVTAVEQPVGLVLDKSGRGNHASQSTAAKRPVLSARYNLLTYTEVFNANWNNSALITPNTALSPRGTLTAGTLTSNGTLNNVYTSTTGAAASAQYKLSVSVKYTNNQWIFLQLSDPGTSHRARAWFDIQNGAKGTSQVTGSGVVVDYKISAEGDGWYRCELTATNPITTIYSFVASLVPGDGSLTVAANGQSCYIWGADIRPANDGVGLPPYQRVGTTATDYDTTGFPAYLLFDGVDDALVTGSISFTNTSKATVFAGVRKLSDAVGGLVVELGNAVSTSFMLFAPNGALANYAPGIISDNPGVAGIEFCTGRAAPFAAPITNVVTGMYDSFGAAYSDKVKGRVNAVAQSLDFTNSFGILGLGNFAAAPLYIGARGATSICFNGRLYGLIVRGAQTSDAQIAQTETYLNRIAKIY